MYNAACKLASAALIAAAASLAGCGGDSTARQATELYTQAQTAVAEGRYAEAIDLLDTLDVRCRSAVDVRRQGLALRQHAIEGVTLDSIATCSEQLACAQLAYDSLSALVHEVYGVRGLEGYKTACRGRLAADGVQGRVDSDGYFNLAVSVHKLIGLRSVEFVGEGVNASTASISAGRLVTVEGSQLAVFSQEEVVAAMSTLEMHSSGPLTCVLRGERSDVKVRLDARAASDLLTTWRYAQACQQLRSALIRREQLERTLMMTRDHIATLVVDDATQTQTAD